jgi:hypothetical protein
MRPLAAVSVLAATLIGLGGVLASTSEVVAGPPEADRNIDTEPADAGVDVVPAPPGLWLSLELIGPRGAQLDAAEALRVAPIVDALPRGGSPPPGELVGRVDTLEQALTWVAQQAFDAGAIGFEQPAAATAPLPGGRLRADHGVHLTALVVTAASPSGGTQAFAWPPADLLPTPAAWLPASLVVARAPVFAAPGPRLPPASERYRTATRADAIWQLGALDRCDDAGRCLRWAQILVREGDRWYGGWVLAAQVVADREWVGGPDERRFALIASHRDRAQVGHVLIEQQHDQQRPPRGLSQALVGSEWPSASLAVVGERLIVQVAGQPALTLDLTPAAAPTLTP